MSLSKEQVLELMQRIEYRDDIPYFLKFVGLNGKMCELGVDKGKHLDYLRKKASPTELIGIDSWESFPKVWTQEEQDAKREKVTDWFSQYGNTTIVHAKIEEQVNEYPDGYFDFIYLDSNHLYDPAVNDISQWWPKVKSGGIFAGHDYIDTWRRGYHFEVFRAVDEFVAAKDIKKDLHITKERFASWLILKD